MIGLPELMDATRKLRTAQRHYMLYRGGPGAEALGRKVAEAAAEVDKVMETLGMIDAAHADAGSYQQRVAKWMSVCFADDVCKDIQERGDRLLEETLEYLQAHGYDPARVATLTQYVYSRPVGEPKQELGGVMVTLAAHANAVGLDMQGCGEVELNRVWGLIDKIRAKQASKRDIHGPLPV